MEGSVLGMESSRVVRIVAGASSEVVGVDSGGACIDDYAFAEEFLLR
jgi:hypothetical protein